MKIQCFISFVIFLFLLSVVQAQENLEIFLERKMESILENSEQYIEPTELFDRLIEIVNNPVNINGSDFEVLLAFKLISDKQYHSILSYRYMVGKIQSIAEIQFLEGFNKDILELLKPFIYAGERTKVKLKLSQLLRNSSHQVILRNNQFIQAKAGYHKVSNSSFQESPNKYYLGSAAKIYARYKLVSKDYFSAGLLLEKDAGEVLFKPKYNSAENLLEKQIQAVDFTSFYLKASNLGFIKKIVLGDYHLQFGQGLTLWSNFAFNKSAEVTSIKRYAGNIIPNTSALENNFFRGMALSSNLGKINLAFFYSNKYRDANIFDRDENMQISTITSLQNTGLHRTINEIKNRNVLKEQIYGSRISFKTNALQLGSTVYGSKWNANLLPSEQVQKIFNFSGHQNSCIGFDYQWFRNNTSFFGEISMSQNHGTAYLAGLDLFPDSYSKLSILYRNFQAKFQNLYANAFGENNVTKNEKGLYFGFDNYFLPNWQIHFYMDIYKFPWLKSTTSAPANGMDFFLQLNYEANENFQIYFRFKRKNNQSKYTANNWISDLVQEKKEHVRVNLVYKPSAIIRFKSRVEWVKFAKKHNQNQHGILIYQQMEYSFTKKPLKLYFRYTNFNTDGFESRIYTYENDVLYNFSIPAFYDTGNHFYFLANYKMNKNINIWFKLAHTHFEGRESIGTGNETISGSSKTEIKFQLRVQL